ncbi:hypothetical protein AAVH_22885 [Aphelenchoides avenae]|nr:hypothetical protein AAVH_22885 [Aphelenchus avenae]
MMLVNESLLQVLHFADYKTLVLAKLAAAPFLRLGIKYAEELACRHRFRVECWASWITLKDVTLDTQLQVVHYQRDNEASLAAACRKVAEYIGPHAVGQLVFYVYISYMPGVIFEAASPLAHAEDVWLFKLGTPPTTKNSDAFLSNFEGMKSLRLWLDNNVFREFGWTFLRAQSGPELPHTKYTMTIKLSREAPDEEIESSIEELVRSCATLSLPGGEALDLTLDFIQNYCSEAFGLRIIELLKNSEREVTFMMRTTRDVREFIRDESDYMVEVDGTTTRYVSKQHGIAVEKRGWIVIKSTAEVPSKKRRV